MCHLLDICTIFPKTSLLTMDKRTCKQATFMAICDRLPLLKCSNFFGQIFHMAWQYVHIARQHGPYCKYWPTYCQWYQSPRKNMETLPSHSISLFSPRGLSSHIPDLSSCDCFIFYVVNHLLFPSCQRHGKKLLIIKFLQN